MELPKQPISRRRLLGGAAGLAGVAGFGAIVSACGSSATSFTVAQRFPPDVITPGMIRLPISLAESSGTLTTKGPAVLTGRVRDDQGTVLGSFRAKRRAVGLQIPYWAIEAEVPAPGLYEFSIDGFSGEATPFQVTNAASLEIPVVGRPLPPFDTPTTDDPRGVDPICTRLEGPCPFHDLTLTEALASGKPVVYVIGTPAHCQTGTCGPSLEVMIDVARQFADRAVFVHAEVYADQQATTVAPALTAYNLLYEPVFWTTDASGTVTRRVDIVWDREELTEILAAEIS